MSHLTNEQFEDIIQGNISPPEHLDKCPDCQNLLMEKKALAERLRLAFASVRANPGLEDRIRSQINQVAPSSQTAVPARNAWRVHFRKRVWPGLAAAAALLVVLVPLSFYFSSTSQANAAQAELVKIHYQGIGPHGDFYTDAEPENLAEYFKAQLGFIPAFPRLGQGMSLRGCCVKHFRGEMVGSYVVDTPEGVISVIAVTDTPKSMGLTQMPEQEGSDQIFWQGSFARCSMIVVRLGNYSYCAVGEVSHDLLTDLLGRLLR